MKFDLQTYLSEMRQEQNENHQMVVNKVDEVKKEISAHDTRIVVLENTRRNVRWAVTTAIGAALTVVGPAAYDFIARLTALLTK